MSIDGTTNMLTYVLLRTSRCTLLYTSSTPVGDGVFTHVPSISRVHFGGCYEQSTIFSVQQQSREPECSKRKMISTFPSGAKDATWHVFSYTNLRIEFLVGLICLITTLYIYSYLL